MWFFWIMYLILSMLAFVAWAFVQGRSTERYRNDQTITDNPPYFLLSATAFLWPLQLVGTLGWLLWRFSYGRGTGRGMAINEELTIARRVASELRIEQHRIMAEILTKGLDPKDELGLRALTESTVRHSMEVERLTKQKAAKDREYEGYGDSFTTPLTSPDKITAVHNAAFELDRLRHLGTSLEL